MLLFLQPPTLNLQSPISNLQISNLIFILPYRFMEPKPSASVPAVSDVPAFVMVFFRDKEDYVPARIAIKGSDIGTKTTSVIHLEDWTAQEGEHKSKVVEVVRVAYSKEEVDRLMKAEKMMEGPDLYEIREKKTRDPLYIVWLPPRLKNQIEIARYEDGKSVEASLRAPSNKVLDEVHSLLETKSKIKWTRQIDDDYPIVLGKPGQATEKEKE